MTLLLGKAPPLRYPADIAIKAADYINLKKLPATPKVLPSIGRGITYDMLLNDQLGDCTCAAVGHMVETHSTRAGAHIEMSDTDVRTLFHDTGVEQNLTDNDGRYMEGVLKHLKEKGVRVDGTTHKILGYAYVDYRDLELYRACTWLFGGTYNGYALPLSAENQVGKVWKITTGSDAAPGSWGGHCVFKTVPGTAITWAQRQAMTWAWHRVYCDEAYGVLTDTWINVQGKAPNGFARDELVRDLAQL